MRGISIAARVLVVLLAVAVSCGPLCRRHVCAHDCCGGHHGSCGSSVTQNPVAACDRTVALPAFSSGENTTLAPCSLQADMAGLTRPALPFPQGFGAGFVTRASSVPAPPLRI